MKSQIVVKSADGGETLGWFEGETDKIPPDIIPPDKIPLDKIPLGQNPPAKGHR